MTDAPAKRPPAKKKPAPARDASLSSGPDILTYTVDDITISILPGSHNHADITFYHKSTRLCQSRVAFTGTNTKDVHDAVKHYVRAQPARFVLLKALAGQTFALEDK